MTLAALLVTVALPIEIKHA